MSAVDRVTAGRIPFVVPDNAPRWCNALNMSECEARDLFEPKNVYTIAPAKLERIGIWVATVSCAGPGRPFLVRDREGQRCFIVPRWSQAAAAMVDIALEYEAAARQSGDVRTSTAARNVRRPRTARDGIRLDQGRRREVISTLRGALAIPTRSPLTPWEVELAGAILDVLHSRRRGLSSMESDHIDRLMQKITGRSR